MARSSASASSVSGRSSRPYSYESRTVASARLPPIADHGLVVAQPDSKWGETPCAFVELKDGATVTADEIMAHCRTLLAGFKVPKAVYFGPLPKTSTGKIQKFELRKQLKSNTAIDV